MRPAIRVDSLSKRYQLGQRSGPGYRTLRESLTGSAAGAWHGLKQVGSRFVGKGRGEAAADPGEFWALKDVSFEVQPGEVVGIIGRNGAGKSTLLKILSRITEPSSGRAEVRGRMGSLLEVGTGFHPELTGRENIYLNGSILGMSRHEITRKFDDIVAFSEIEQFLDTPVKRYSSGMYIRLAFAVAAHLEPEILVVDEVLAVGDVAFQQKCLGRMQELGRSGRTILLVSHNLPMIQCFSQRCVFLDAGKLLAVGSTDRVVAEYVQNMMPDSPSVERGIISLGNHPNRRAGLPGLLTGLRILDRDGRPTSHVGVGDAVTFEITCATDEKRRGVDIGIVLCNQARQRIVLFNTKYHSQLNVDLDSECRLRCEVPSLPLLPGSYQIDIAAGTCAEMLDYIEWATTLHVIATDYFGTGALPAAHQGIIALPAHWAALEVTG